MHSAYAPTGSVAGAGPSRPRLEPPNSETRSDLPPKQRKRRRLQFSSQLHSNTVQRYNPDGTETVEYLHQQSTQRLKRKWDSIFERFKDAHLQEQDEIYLGNRANGEPIVVVKDRGSLRSLRQSMEFGVFIKDEELQGWKERPEARETQEQDNGYEDDFDPSHAPLLRSQLAGASSSESEEEEDDPAANDPDLREFLQAEARRKAMLGESGDDEEDEVVDFAHPLSSAQVTARIAPQPLVESAPAPVGASDRTAAQPPSISGAPDLIISSSEDEDDTDVVTVHSDSDEELFDSIRTKRQNIEELVQCTTPFETLPYNDIFALADLLKISDNTSRLYVDLVSDDEDQDVSKQIPEDDVLELTASLPNPLLQALPSKTASADGTVVEVNHPVRDTNPVAIDNLSPISSLFADAPSSPLSELPPSRASSAALNASASTQASASTEASSHNANGVAIIADARSSPSSPLSPSQASSIASNASALTQAASPFQARSPKCNAPTSMRAISPFETPRSMPNDVGTATDASSSPLTQLTPSRASSIAANAPGLTPAVRCLETRALPYSVGVVDRTPERVAAKPLDFALSSPSRPVAAPAVSLPTLQSDPIEPATLERTEHALYHDTHFPRATPTRHLESERDMGTSTSTARSPFKISASCSAPVFRSHLERSRSRSSSASDKHSAPRSSPLRKNHARPSKHAHGTRRKSLANPTCGGPGRCSKTFCFDCASSPHA